MRILVITVTRNRKGVALRTERTVEADLARLGRGTQCEIHLPDPRVSLYHAAIYRQGDSLFIQAPEAELSVDGGAEREARLVPRVHVALGPYDLTVEPAPEGYDLALAIELARPMPDDLAAIKAKSRTTLERSGLSRRTTAWTLALLIAVLFLAVPVFNALVLPLRPLTAKLPLTPDQSWNPGVLSAAHQEFGRNCGKCHEIPFVPVRDHACLECHRSTPGHIEDAALQQRLFDGRHCASCHAEHKGPVAPVRRDLAVCVDCHGHLKRFDANATLADVTDFAVNEHPEFKLSIWQGPGPRDVIRVAQTDKGRLIQRSNLKFPHDVHLKSSLSTPKGRETLDCASCHVPDTSGRSFVAIDMERVCLRCHTLEFEPIATKLQVRHSKEAEVMLTLQGFYAKIAVDDTLVDVVDLGVIRQGLPRFSGGVISEAEQQRIRAWANAKAERVAEDLFEKRVCIVCHEVSKMPPGEGETQTTWKITPVHVATSWFPKARFDHASHRTGDLKCADCHAVARSHSSADIAIPDIRRCRECHAGSSPERNKVVSTCVSCHGFHLPGHPPLGTRAAAAPGKAP